MLASWGRTGLVSMYDVTPDQSPPQLLVLYLFLCVECIGYGVRSTTGQGASFERLPFPESTSYGAHSLRRGLRPTKVFVMCNLCHPTPRPASELLPPYRVCRRGDPQTGSLPVDSNHTDHVISCCYVTYSVELSWSAHSVQ